MSAEESVYPRLRATRLSWERISYIEHIAREKVHRYWRWYIDQTVSSSSPFYRRNVWKRLKKRKTMAIWLLIIHVKISSKLKILPHLRDLQNLIGILIIISNCKFSFLANNSCKIIDLSLVTILVTVALRLSREHGHHHTVMVVVASFAVAIIGRNITKYFASPGGAAAEIAGQFHGHKGKFTGM